MMNFLSALRRGDMRLPSSDEALPGRPERVAVPARHFVNGRSLEPPFPADTERAVFAMGCFWGAERLFWEIDGVHSTSAGYIAGETPNPTYEEVCSGLTGHTEAVLVVFDPRQVSYEALLTAFWENHGLQCGYCTPGMLLASYALLSDNPKPDEAEIRRALAGNLCMCTGYMQIVQAVKAAAEEMASKAEDSE